MSLSIQTTFRLLVSVVAITLASTAQAATYRWSFNDLTFFDGGKASGTFYSNGTSFYNWDITTYWDPALPGFPEMVSPYHYTGATSTLEAGSSFRLLRNDTPSGNFLELSFSEALDHAGVFYGSALERTESFGGSITSHSGDFDVSSVGRVRPSRPRLASLQTAEMQAVDSRAMFSREEVDIATPVPEPETLAMTLAGLLMVGAVAKRRQAKRG